MKLLLSVPEAARQLGVGRNRFWSWVHAGKVPAAKDGRRYFVPSKALDEVVRKIEAGEWTT